MNQGGRNEEFIRFNNNSAGLSALDSYAGCGGTL